MNLSVADQKWFYIEKNDINNKNCLYLKVNEFPPLKLTDPIGSESLISLEESFSLREFKSIFKDTVHIIQPEKFVQYIAKENMFPKQDNWEMEYSFNNDAIKQNGGRFDFVNIIKEESHGRILSIIENKNYVQKFGADKKSSKLTSEQTEKNINEAKKAALKDIEDYIDQILNNPGGSLSFGKSECFPIAVMAYDGEYLFNNPNLLNNLRALMEYNQSFFNIFYYEVVLTKDPLPKIKEINEINEKGILGGFELEDSHVFDNDVEIVRCKVGSLSNLPTDTNPRDSDIVEALTLSSVILSDIIKSMEEGIKYKAQHYTGEKTITCKHKIYKSKNKTKNYYYGVGLSVDNGQHSTTAYKYVLDLINDPEKFKETYGNDGSFKMLIDGFNKKLESIELSSLQEYIKDITLNAKLVVSKNKQQLERIKASNNKQTKATMPSNTFGSLKIILMSINNELYNNGSLIQIKIPKIDVLKDFNYLSEDLLGRLFRIFSSGRSLPLQVYRSSDPSNIDSFADYVVKSGVGIKKLRDELINLSKEMVVVENKILELSEAVESGFSSLIEDVAEKKGLLQEMRFKENEYQKQIKEYESNIKHPKEDNLNKFNEFLLRNAKYFSIAKNSIRDKNGCLSKKDGLEICFILSHMEKLKKDFSEEELKQIEEDLLVKRLQEVYKIWNKGTDEKAGMGYSLNSIINGTKSKIEPFQEAIYQMVKDQTVPKENFKEIMRSQLDLIFGQ